MSEGLSSLARVLLASAFFTTAAREVFCHAHGFCLLLAKTKSRTSAPSAQAEWGAYDLQRGSNANQQEYPTHAILIAVSCLPYRF
jgi:hypothetical protein